jgi:hypothetical protein
MRANMSDVIASSGAVLMAGALAGMVADLGAGVVPAAPVTMLFSLGLLAVVAALVWRFEQAAARQLRTADSLRDIRARRAQLMLRQQTETASPQTILAA